MTFWLKADCGMASTCGQRFGLHRDDMLARCQSSESVDASRVGRRDQRVLVQTQHDAAERHQRSVCIAPHHVARYAAVRADAKIYLPLLAALHVDARDGLIRRDAARQRRRFDLHGMMAGLHEIELKASGEVRALHLRIIQYHHHVADAVASRAAVNRTDCRCR